MILKQVGFTKWLQLDRNVDLVEDMTKGECPDCFGGDDISCGTCEGDGEINKSKLIYIKQSRRDLKVAKAAGLKIISPWGEVMMESR